MQQPVRKPAQATQIRKILGDVDDADVVAILAMGVTEAEVLEAAQWLRADDDLRRTLGHGPDGRVAELCELLAPDDAEDAALSGPSGPAE